MKLFFCALLLLTLQIHVMSSFTDSSEKLSVPKPWQDLWNASHRLSGRETNNGFVY